jgi:hypothetical protein
MKPGARGKNAASSASNASCSKRLWLQKELDNVAKSTRAETIERHPALSNNNPDRTDGDSSPRARVNAIIANLF